MWPHYIQTTTGATMALFALLLIINFGSLTSNGQLPHHNTKTMAPHNTTTENETNDFEVITANEVSEIQQQQASRAVLGIRPAAGASSKGRRFFKGALRTATAAVATGAAKVAQKVAEKTKVPKEPTPDQALCPCLADPVNGWMSCKIYGHVRAKLKEKGIVAA
ncbi:uncharacterized protein IWZ02DRAFT_18688 [Phyllosticta citriasiana]|uniref:Uncharacterized protein n=1 Tax=Phyllosticta citriasiana TaxID=595635 RepID=A0ABR1KEP8_9PEZI